MGWAWYKSESGLTFMGFTRCAIFMQQDILINNLMIKIFNFFQKKCRCFVQMKGQSIGKKQETCDTLRTCTEPVEVRNFVPSQEEVSQV